MTTKTTKTTKAQNASLLTDAINAEQVKKQKLVQTSKTHTQQAYTKETGERVYTFTNAELKLVSNPEKVRRELAKLLKTNTVEQIKACAKIKQAIAKKVNITTARATVLIRDNINKVASAQNAQSAK